MEAHTIRGEALFADGFPMHLQVTCERGPTRRHAHDFLEIAYAARGSGTHHVGRASYEVHAGDLFVINTDQAHHYDRTEDLEVWYVIVGHGLLQRHIARLKEVPGFREFFYVEPAFREETKFSQHLHLDRAVAREFEDLFRRMMDEQKAKEPGYALVLESAMVDLFVRIGRLYVGYCRRNVLQKEIASKREAVDQVLAFIEQRYGEDIRLSDLARCGCLQSQYLCRVFRKKTGMTMVEYLTRTRIQKATELLARTSASVTDICAEVGFHDLSHFIRTFRKTTGMSPSKYRKETPSAVVSLSPES